MLRGAAAAVVRTCRVVGGADGDNVRAVPAKLRSTAGSVQQPVEEADPRRQDRRSALLGYALNERFDEEIGEHEPGTTRIDGRAPPRCRRTPIGLAIDLQGKVEAFLVVAGIKRCETMRFAQFGLRRHRTPGPRRQADH